MGTSEILTVPGTNFMSSIHDWREMSCLCHLSGKRKKKQFTSCWWFYFASLMGTDCFHKLLFTQNSHILGIPIYNTFMYSWRKTQRSCHLRNVLHCSTPPPTHTHTYISGSCTVYSCWYIFTHHLTESISTSGGRIKLFGVLVFLIWEYSIYISNCESELNFWHICLIKPGCDIMGYINS